LLAPIFGSITIETQSIISSSRYIDLVDAAVNKNYPLFKGLSETTSKQVFQVINDGIDGGLSKNAIRRKILERYEVAKSSAKRIVDTEVNKAYNNARTDLIQDYRDNGEPLAVQHISALLATTRSHHAARHGLAYTPEQQNKWWNSGTNRINCHCSIRAIVVNRDGTVANKAAQNKVIARGKQIFKSNT
jgi:SPP1 gp7 family putative phage head morphogenesis protein